MSNGFLPTKPEWDAATRILDTLRELLKADGADDAPASIVEALRKVLAQRDHAEVMLASVRMTFAHLPGPRGESVLDICERVADMHRRQAETIESLRQQVGYQYNIGNPPKGNSL